MSATALYTNIKLFEARREINIDKMKNSLPEGNGSVKGVPGEPQAALPRDLLLKPSVPWDDTI